VGERTLIATDHGLWELVTGRMEFRRFATKSPSPLVSYLSSTATGALLAISGGALWFNEAGSAWKPVATERSNGGGLLWVAESLRDAKQWLLGTQRGVFIGGPGGEWRLIGNGLPATASVAPAFTGSRCLMAMSNGGLYESSDGLKTWRRVDTDAERGRVSQLASAEQGFVVGSEQEGVLLRSST